MEKKEDLLNHLRSLNEVSNTLMKCQSIEELIQKALAEVRLRLKVQVASIFLFVSIFTAFPKYRQQARNLHTDFYLEKSLDIKTNIRQIADKILNHQMEIII